jgi:hypothetical protein
MKNLTFIFCILLATQSFGQFSLLRKIPVKPVFDIGFSLYGNAPNDMELSIVGSRAINISLLYEVYISDYVTFNTGLGLGIERYSFDKNITIREGLNSLNQEIVGVFPLTFYNDVRKSLLTPTYIDLPVEFRFVTSTGRETFRFILGFKAGVLAAAHTKIKYGTGDNVRTEKLKDDFFLNQIRYGVYSRIGYKSIHLFTYYSLSDLFQKNKLTPNQAITPMMFGLTFLMY